MTDNRLQELILALISGREYVGLGELWRMVTTQPEYAKLDFKSFRNVVFDMHMRDMLVLDMRDGKGRVYKGVA